MIRTSILDERIGKKLHRYALIRMNWPVVTRYAIPNRHAENGRFDQVDLIYSGLVNGRAGGNDFRRDLRSKLGEVLLEFRHQ